MDDKLGRLLALGFFRAGYWYSSNKDIVCQLEDRADAANVLYAFVTDRNVNFLGETVHFLPRRLAGYRKPPTSQPANFRVNREIRKCLGEGKQVEIYMFADSDMFRLGGFHLNLAAGLEAGIIRDLAPAWNGGQQDIQESVHATIDAPPRDRPLAPAACTSLAFRATLVEWFREIGRAMDGCVDVNAGELHRHVGSYPGPDHRMTACCTAMKEFMHDGDQIVTASATGEGPTLTIRYMLPRRNP